MCDCLVALPNATRDGATLFAKNSDRPPDERQEIETVLAGRIGGEVRCTHITVELPGGDSLRYLMSRPTWCWGAEHGVNEAGVAIGNEAIYTTLDPRRQPAGLIGMDFVRLALMSATSAHGAVGIITDLLERYGQGGSGHDPRGASGPKPYFSSFLIADRVEAWVLETSGRQWAAERVDHTTGVRAISNRTTIAAFDAEHRNPRQPVARFVDARLAASNAVLAQRPVTVASLAEHLRSHDSCAEAGWSVCMHAADDAGNLVEATTASMIAELRVAGPPLAHVLIGWPCEQEYQTVVVG